MYFLQLSSARNRPKPTENGRKSWKIGPKPSKSLPTRAVFRPHRRLRARVGLHPATAATCQSLPP